MEEGEETGAHYNHELVMPFIVVSSKGGPFDDAAYCAGWEMGFLDYFLGVWRHEDSRHAVDRVIRRENLPQADLLAMMHGAEMSILDWPEDTEVSEQQNLEWAYVRFARGTDV